MYFFVYIQRCLYFSSQRSIYYLEASDKQTMMYWLQQLQQHRHSYNTIDLDIFGHRASYNKQVSHISNTSIIQGYINVIWFISLKMSLNYESVIYLSWKSVQPKHRRAWVHIPDNPVLTIYIY